MQKFEKDILDILKSFKTRSHMENCDVLDAIEEYVTVEKIDEDQLIFSDDFKNFIFEAACKKNLIDKKFIVKEEKNTNELELF